MPVVGMAEASCHMAAQFGRRFAIVTGGPRWVPMLEEFVAGIGLADRLACVTAVAPSGGDIARDPAAAYDLLAEACNACVADHGAEVVILGGAGLAGIAPKLTARVPVPLVDSVAAVVKTAEAVVLMGAAKPRAGSYAPAAPTETVGLSPALAAALLGARQRA